MSTDIKSSPDKKDDKERERRALKRSAPAGHGSETNRNDPRSLRCRVFIGNLPTDKMSRQDVEKIFMRHGRVTGVSIHNNYGFVQYADEAGADEAVTKEHGQVLFGKKVDVNLAGERKKIEKRGPPAPPHPRDLEEPPFRREREMDDRERDRLRRSPPRDRGRFEDYDSFPPRYDHFRRSPSPVRRREEHFGDPLHGRRDEDPYERGRYRDDPFFRDREPFDRREGPPSLRELPPDRRGLPHDRRDLPLDRRELPPDRRDLPPDRRDLPPDRRDLPPDRRDLPPDRRDLPPDRRDLPPDRRDLPPDRRDLPPDRRDLPPDHRDLPPDRRDLPPDRRDLPPDRRDLPPDRRDLPPDRRDLPPDRRESPPVRRDLPPMDRRELSPGRSRRELPPPDRRDSRPPLRRGLSPDRRDMEPPRHHGEPYDRNRRDPYSRPDSYYDDYRRYDSYGRGYDDYPPSKRSRSEYDDRDSYQSKPVQAPTDCVILVVNKQQRGYAEMVERRLRSLGLVVEHQYLGTLALTETLDEVSRRGILYAVVVTSQHEVHRSVTVNILHGTQQAATVARAGSTC